MECAIFPLLQNHMQPEVPSEAELLHADGFSPSEMKIQILTAPWLGFVDVA